MQPELQTRCRVGRGLGRCRSRAWMVGGRWASSARMVPPVVPQGLPRLCSEFVRGSAQSLSAALLRVCPRCPCGRAPTAPAGPRLLR